MKRTTGIVWLLVLGVALTACSGPRAGQPGAAVVAGRGILKEAMVPASPGQVWEAWTTVEGVKTFFAPEARIDLRAGGAYEMYFDPSQEPGKRGSEGCTILAVEPERRLVFNWNFPPSLPDIRNEKTFVEITFVAAEGEQRTRVRLVQRGFKSGSDWDKGRAHFDEAWDLVLKRLVQRFTSGPVDLKK